MTPHTVQLCGSNDANLPSIQEFRHRLLREPWGVPPEHPWDPCDEPTYFGLVMNGNIWEQDHIIATGRIHAIDQQLAQIRYMAIDANYQRQGLGRLILQALEQQARAWKIPRIFLNARDNAIPFYLATGYHDVAPAETIFGTIIHRRMEKLLLP